MKKILILIAFIVAGTCFGQQSKRELKTVTFEGSGYELGLQHGKALQSEIADIIKAWKDNTTEALDKDADVVLDDFYEYANFDDYIKEWTPDLYAEVQGIAEGSGQEFNDVFILNLLDEFWVYVNDLYNQENHHCSAMGVPATKDHPGYVSQNMDLEDYTDGFQVLMRLKKTEDSPEQLVLTYPGLIGLNGINENGLGVVVNTLMQLKASSTGLPVAFVVRRLINSKDKADMLDFIKNVKHASGQNYILGIHDEIYDFEASTDKVVRFNPENENGSVYHTNHPIVNDDVKPWFQKYNPDVAEETKPKDFNSYHRLQAVENRIANTGSINENVIMETLRSKDDAENPVCRSNSTDGGGFTFASIVMKMAEEPFILLTAGPPDESDYQRFGFKE